MNKSNNKKASKGVSITTQKQGTIMFNSEEELYEAAHNIILSFYHVSESEYNIVLKGAMLELNKIMEAKFPNGHFYGKEIDRPYCHMLFDLKGKLLTKYQEIKNRGEDIQPQDYFNLVYDVMPLFV